MNANERELNRKLAASEWGQANENSFLHSFAAIRLPKSVRPPPCFKPAVLLGDEDEALLTRTGLVQFSVQVIRGADERQMGEGLGEIAELLAAVANFFRIETHVIGITEGFLKIEPSEPNISRASQAFDIPEGAGGEGSLTSRKTGGGAF